MVANRIGQGSEGSQVGQADKANSPPDTNAVTNADTDADLSTYLNRMAVRSFLIGRPLEAIFYSKGDERYLLVYADGRESEVVDVVGRWSFDSRLNLAPDTDGEFLTSIIWANAQARKVNPAGKGGKAGSVSVARVKRNRRVEE